MQRERVREKESEEGSNEGRVRRGVFEERRRRTQKVEDVRLKPTGLILEVLSLSAHLQDDLLLLIGQNQTWV